jgi:predicted nucleotidyltransferase/DNA-binding XRE family transcriptional regulator
MDAAELLRLARQRAGLTQAELARRAGTSQSAIARYESGVTSPSVRTLERLLYVLGQQLRLTVEPRGTGTGPTSERMQRLHNARESIQRAVHRIGASNVRVFGSVARGQDRPESDIDLLVDFDIHAHGALPLIRLRRELSQLLNDRIDIATPELLRPDVAARAISEAVVL